MCCAARNQNSCCSNGELREAPCLVRVAAVRASFIEDPARFLKLHDTGNERREDRMLSPQSHGQAVLFAPQLS
jgi:hypothetical protein